MARRRSRRRSSRRRSASRRPKRRSTRRRASKRRATKRRRSTKRRTSRAQTPRRPGTGRLRWHHVTASLVRDRDPAFRGRIRLDRGAGVLEFPTPKQFQKIAREEGVPPEVVDRAFGHLLSHPSRKKTPKRASRRQRPLDLGTLLFGWVS